MPRRVASGPSAYVKISDGCNQKCAFCAIPSMKGLLASKPRELILKEIGELKEQGFARSSWWPRTAPTTAATGASATAWRASCAPSPTPTRTIPWIRVMMYAYPSHVTQAFLEVMAERPQVCNYFDMPLQHTHPETLRRMRRRTARPTNCSPGSARWCRRRFARPSSPARRDRGRAPPRGRAIETLGFGRVGAFLYSDEEGTASFNHPNRIAKSVKMRRRHELMAAAQAASLRANRALVGTVQEVLIEGEGELDGRAVRVGRPWDARKSTASSSWTAGMVGGDRRGAGDDGAEYDLVGEPSGSRQRPELVRN